LLGRLAIKDTYSKYAADYNHDHLTEAAIGLRLSQSGSVQKKRAITRDE
jgi:hypothetical protein